MEPATLATMRGFPLQNPSQGRLVLQKIAFAPSTLQDVSFEFSFDPISVLHSPMCAASFFLARLADVGYTAGLEIACDIARFAYNQCSSRGWTSGLSLSVDLTTIYGLEQQEQQPRRSPDFMDEDNGNPGMSEQEIDEEDEEWCCSICLEGFTRGALITTLCPCSHKFHTGCIVQWLINNRSCPICRTRCDSWT